MKKSIVL